MLQLDQEAQPVPAIAGWPVFISLLGSFSLFNRGGAVAVPCGGKTEGLLTVLALRGEQGLSREPLLALLWPNHAPDLASQSLNSLVYSLRKQFSTALQGSPLVLHSEGHYQLNLAAGVGIDLIEFETQIREGDRRAQMGHSQAALSAYRCALEFYRGDLWGVTDIYAAVERERLRASYLTALAWLADAAYTRGDYAACLDYARRLLASDPCREDAHRLLMRCYVHCAQRAQALRQYHFCVEVLRAEFDTLPEPSTTSLYDQIRMNPVGI
jgi:DNA-binding SARP family transcriptional activator